MKAKKKPRGPTPETLKIEGDWKEAVRHVLRRGKPPEEPPKKTKPKKKKSKR